MLQGEISFSELETAEESWFHSGYLLTDLDDPELLAKVASRIATCEILIFLGTWCGDTREYLPELVKILDEAKFPRSKIRMIALGRDKKGMLTEEFGIERLPTFVVLRGGQELGRIVESPKLSLLEDLEEILERHPR